MGSVGEVPFSSAWIGRRAGKGFAPDCGPSCRVCTHAGKWGCKVEGRRERSGVYLRAG